MKMDEEVIEDGWSWEENKLFEVALAVVDEAKADRWEAVAAMVGGNKSAHQVQTHYVLLLKDLELIESGKFDHKLIDGTNISISDEEDHNLLQTVTGIKVRKPETTSKQCYFFPMHIICVPATIKQKFAL